MEQQEIQKDPIHILQSLIMQFAIDRDWLQFHTPKNLSMAISAETAELMEHFLWISDWEQAEQSYPPEKIQKIREELADVLILCFQMANILQLDIQEIMLEKIRLNNQKYPVEKAKGNALKYTEFPK